MQINQCPKCGREPVSMKVYASTFFCGWKIECFNCELYTGCCKSEGRAVAKWNKLTEKIKNETTKA